MKRKNLRDMMPVTKPYLPPRQELQKYIDEIYDNQYLTNNGPLHNRFEAELKAYLDVPNLILTVNGHAGLDIILKAFNITGKVITTPFTFVSTTHALTLNDIEPVFCDIKADDLTINEEKIEELITADTTAIMPVYVYGHMCNVEKIKEIADRHKLKVIYDAAHAFGVRYKGKALAQYGDASMLSFHATKIFNTIEGGAVVYRDPNMSRLLGVYKNFGIEGPEKVDFVGANAKMNEFQAAMGLANLAHIPEILAERKTIVELYRRELDDIPGIRYFVPEKLFQDYEYNYSYFPIVVEKSYGKSRDELYEYLLDNNIYSRKYFYPIVSRLGCYKEKYSNVNLPVAEEISKRVLCLPLYNGMELDDVAWVCKMVERFKHA